MFLVSQITEQMKVRETFFFCFVFASLVVCLDGFEIDQRGCLEGLAPLAICAMAPSCKRNCCSFELIYLLFVVLS